jgi:hypothetical protein
MASPKILLETITTVKHIVQAFGIVGSPAMLDIFQPVMTELD